jgi:tetratricopeptide (TPR) repeat protein
MDKLAQKGISFIANGEFHKAYAIYEEILKISPEDFNSLQLLGGLCLRMKEYDKAVQLLSKAMKINPHHIACCNNLGIAFKELKRFEEAVTIYDQAILIQPDYALAYYNRGNALQELKRFEEAVTSYEKAILIQPDYALAYYNRGNALQELKRFEEAVTSYEKAILIQPDYAQSFYNLANALRELKQFEKAVMGYEQALLIDPTLVGTHSNCGIALHALGRLEEALISYDKAISVDSHQADLFYNRALVLQGLGRLEEALISYDKAIGINSGYADALSNRGNVLQSLGRLEEALISYDKAINIDAEHADANWNKSLALLMNGDFEKGWPLYEWRWKSDESSKMSDIRNFHQPLWIGQTSLVGKTILLHAEQGMGDTIQFSRYAPLVAQLGAKVILEVQPDLVSLLKGFQGVDKLIPLGKQLPDFDYHCPLLSLPLAFKTDLYHIPAPDNLIKADSELMARWQSALGRKTMPRIGLVWSGNPSHRNDSNRSLSLERLVSYLPSGYEYVALQKDLRGSDQRILQDHSGIKYFGYALQNFSDTAALCELMDIIISVDTSVAHIAGSLNKPTWLMLPFKPDWRWLLDRDDSPWYPSIQLLRQHSINHWDGVLESIKRKLMALSQ